MSWALGLAGRYWYAIVIAALLGWIWLERGNHADTQQTLDNERIAWTAALREADVKKAEAEAKFAFDLVAATQTYAERLASREPLVIRSTNTVREYAQTDAGRVLCRDADRVRAIDDLDSDIANAPRAAPRGE